MMSDRLDALERLQKLKESGALSEDEFKEEKERLLHNSANASEAPSQRASYQGAPTAPMFPAARLSKGPRKPSPIRRLGFFVLIALCLWAVVSVGYGFLTGGYILGRVSEEKGWHWEPPNWWPGAPPNAASVCTSKETQLAIANLLKEHDQPSIEALAPDRPSAQRRINDAIDRLWGSGNIALTSVTFEGEDAQTHKVSCSALLHFEFTSAQKLISRAMGGASDGPYRNDFPIDYARQPSADGDGFIYSYSDPTRSISLAFAGMLEMLGSGATARDSQSPASPQEAPSPPQDLQRQTQRLT